MQENGAATIVQRFFTCPKTFFTCAGFCFPLHDADREEVMEDEGVEEKKNKEEEVEDEE